jgi:Flp pilus assembly protein TadG
MTAKMKSYFRDTNGAAAIEAGLLLPVMVALLLGTIDVGISLLANMKTTNAAHMVADLLTRSDEVTEAEINDSVVAGELAMLPYDTQSYGVDIVGVQYVGAPLTPTVRWRETRDMEPNPGIVGRTAGLGLQNEGVVAVTVSYTFTPVFSSYFIGEVTIYEEVFARGRKGLFVQRVP